MKIPGFDSLGATPSGPLYADTAPKLTEAVDVAAPFKIAAKAVGEVSEVAGDVLKRAEVAKEKAEALQLAQADTAFQEQVTQSLNGNAETQTPGFLSLEGTRASAETAGTFEKLQQARSKIEDGLPAALRQKFGIKTLQDLASVHRTMESHVSQQNRAALHEAATALTKGVVQDAYNLDDDSSPAAQADVTRRQQEAESLIKQLALSPEGAKAGVEGLQQGVVLSRIQRRLDDGNVDAADRLLETFKKTLGPQAERAQALVARYRAGQVKDQQRAQYEGGASGIIADSGDKFGYVDASKAQDTVSKILESLPEEKRKGFKDTFDDRLNDALARKKAYVDDLKNHARGLWNTNGNSFDDLPGNIQEQLNQYDAEFAHRLQDDSAHATKMKRIAVGGHRPSIAAANREQKALDDTALAQFWKENPDATQRAGIDVDDFCAGLKCSAHVQGVLAKEVAHAKDQVGKGEDRSADGFMRSFTTAARPLFVGKKAQYSADDLGLAQGVAAQRFADESKKAGRPLTNQEEANIVSDVTTNWQKQLYKNAVRSTPAPDATQPSPKKPGAAGKLVKNRKTGEVFRLQPDGTMTKEGK